MCVSVLCCRGFFVLLFAVFLLFWCFWFLFFFVLVVGCVSWFGVWGGWWLVLGGFVFFFGGFCFVAVFCVWWCFCCFCWVGGALGGVCVGLGWVCVVFRFLHWGGLLGVVFYFWLVGHLFCCLYMAVESVIMALEFCVE